MKYYGLENVTFSQNAKNILGRYPSIVEVPLEVLPEDIARVFSKPRFIEEVVGYTGPFWNRKPVLNKKEILETTVVVSDCIKDADFEASGEVAGSDRTFLLEGRVIESAIQIAFDYTVVQGEEGFGLYVKPDRVRIFICVERNYYDETQRIVKYGRMAYFSFDPASSPPVEKFFQEIFLEKTGVKITNGRLIPLVEIQQWGQVTPMVVLPSELHDIAEKGFSVISE